MSMMDSAVQFGRVTVTTKRSH